MQVPTTSFGLDFVAGGLSGCVSKTLAAPIDRVKLLLQTQKVNADLTGNKRYNGTLDCIRRVYREQGPLSFWRGNVANLLRYFPNQALSFSFKDKFRSLLQLEGQKNRTYMVLGNLLASGAAGGSAMAMLYPLDMARTRLATDVGSSLPARRYNGTLHCLQSIYRENGIRGLYTGMSVSIAGVVIFRALFMGGYDVVKQIADIGPNTEVWKKLLCAQSVTLTAGTLCYPIDTVRRRVMMQAKEAVKKETAAAAGGAAVSSSSSSSSLASSAVDMAGSKPVYRSGWHALGKILREEGVRGLYSGLSANLIRGVSGAVLLVGYDELRATLAVVKS